MGISMNLKYGYFLLCVFFVAVLSGVGCDKTPTSDELSNDTIPTIHQGVYGYVEFWEGDFMPHPIGKTSGTITPVSRQILIYSPTTFGEVQQVDYSPFYTRIFTPQVGTTSSNNKGFFQIALPEGTYSFFIMEGSLYYANGSDDQGYLCPVTVWKDSLTFMHLNITYKATF
jgi:hypothetical protein